MRAAQLAAFLVLAAGAAGAQPIAENPPTWTIQCVGVSGQPSPPVCSVPASRVDQREFHCSCPVGGMRVEVDICRPGEREPPNNAALDRVRREAMRDGSLRGDRFEGQPICVAPRGR